MHKIQNSHRNEKRLKLHIHHTLDNFILCSVQNLCSPWIEYDTRLINLKRRTFKALFGKIMKLAYKDVWLKEKCLINRFIPLAYKLFEMLFQVALELYSLFLDIRLKDVFNVILYLSVSWTTNFTKQFYFQSTGGYSTINSYQQHIKK